jgi:N-acetylneuraminic acid mutarotase
VFGGIGDSTKLSTIFRYDISQNKWEDTKTPLHINRGGVLYDKNNQVITILGGKKESQFVTKVFNLNPVSNDLQVEDNSPIRIKRSGFGFIQKESRHRLQGMMFIIGGNDGECILKSVLCINIGANDLVNLPDLCIARDELGVAIDSRGWLYAVGGFGSSLKTCLRSVELFDPHSGEWKVIAEMKCARRGCSTVIIEDCLYVVGGFDGEAYIQELEM